MQAVNVLCIKWGSKYGAEYVNKLYSMVNRHLKRPFRFICLTDNTAGIDAHIETHDIPQVGFADFDQRQPWTLLHGWLKVTSFANPLYDISGPTLFIDLDVVIVDDIGCFFDISPEIPFLVIKEWDKQDDTGNTSVYRFTAGAHSDLIDLLKNHTERELEKVRNEQEFVTQNLSKQGKLQYWPEEWCVSFKRHCMPKGILSWFKPAEVPAGAKIVIFHGKPNPPDVIEGRSGKWYRRVLPAAWVSENWR